MCDVGDDETLCPLEEEEDDADADADDADDADDEDDEEGLSIRATASAFTAATAIMMAL